jgi:hypothetical protein
MTIRGGFLAPLGKGNTGRNDAERGKTRQGGMTKSQ